MRNPFVQTPDNTVFFDTACRYYLPNLKIHTNSIFSNKCISKFNQQAEDLPFQGEFINLVQQENIVLM